MLIKVQASEYAPRWILVPDVVTDRSGTLEAWSKYSDYVVGVPKAFAVQDGMTPDDVPENAAVVFVGGTTEWKWRTVPMWTKHFPRVHFGRCGTSRWKLERLEELGCESCDGSGFFRATMRGREARHLLAWLNPLTKQEQFAWPRENL